MKVTKWNTSIVATGKRSLELRDLRMKGHVLNLEIAEESNRLWNMQLASVSAVRLIAEECGGYLTDFPYDGAMFIVEDSPWVQILNSLQILERAKHFVLFCYDDIVEVVAERCDITELS